MAGRSRCINRGEATNSFSTDGLPIGTQIIGKPFDVATIFGVGHACQHATEWHKAGAESLMRTGMAKLPYTRRWIGLLLGLSLGFAACGGPSVASATRKTGISWSWTAAPQGVDVPGAEWLKIQGAGGISGNVQVAAVLRPQGPGPFPLVVWFHGGLGFLVLDFSKAAPLTAGGFMVLVGCWQLTPSGVTQEIDGVSYQRIPCLKNTYGNEGAATALIEVGRQLPGVKKNAIGLFGVSAGGVAALQYAASNNGIGAVVVDSSPSGPSKVNAPVLMLGATGDQFVSIEEQRNYEQTLRNSGSTVEAHFYEGGRHAVTYFGDFQEDAIKRTIEFFHRYLK